VSRIILVADDNMTIQRMATEMLTEQGLEVVTVANGVAAIKKLATVKPVMVLADVDMPGRDGYEVCDFVKKSAELGGIPVILAFSDADPFDQERVKAVRADAVVRKPFNKIDLLARVEEFVPKAVEERPATSESHPGAGSNERKYQEQTPSPEEFSFTDRPAQKASFAGIPEGAGLFEPELAALVPSEAGPEELYEAIPALATASPARESEEVQSVEKRVEAEFTTAGESGHQAAVTSVQPDRTEFLIASPSQAAAGEGLPSFAEAGIAPGELAGTHGMPAVASPAPQAEESFFVLMANASTEIASTFGELEAASPIAAVAAQETAPEPSLIEMQVSPQTPETAESAPEAISREINIEGQTLSGVLTPPVHDAGSRLGNWKLPEMGPVEQIHAGMEEPVLAVLPDLTAELHLPALIEVAEKETTNPQEALEENHPEAFVAPKVQEIESSVETTVEELEASPEPIPDTHSNLELETPAGELEGNRSSEAPSKIVDAGVASSHVPAPLAGEAEDKGPSEMPPIIRGMKTVEQTAAEEELEGTSASAPDVSTSARAEKELESSPASMLDVPSSTAQHALANEPEENPSWEIPTEAALNEAFLEVALSSIGLIRAKAPPQAPGQLVEQPRAREEVADLFETAFGHASGEPQKTEPVMALEATAAQNLDQKLVEAIVQRVVVRMSPSALSPEMIEHITRKLTEECLEDLHWSQD